MREAAGDPAKTPAGARNCGPSSRTARHAPRACRVCL